MRAVILGIACLAISAGGVAADEVIELRVADSFPTTHVISIDGANHWMARVKELLGERVAFQYFPAQQLGKAGDMLRLVQTGVADVGYVAPAYVTDKMPLSDVGMLPGLFEDACAGTRAYLELATGDGPFAQREFAANGIRPLFVSLLPPYQIIGPTKPITSFRDFEGMKIRSSGGGVDLTIRALGGVPVKLTGAETREGLQRGTIDANLGPNSSLKGYDLYPLMKFGTREASFGSFVVTYSMAQSRWESLPEDVRQALQQAGEETSLHLCAAQQAADRTATEEMAAMGAQFHVPSEEDRRVFGPRLEEVAAQWAAGLDARGEQGTATLDAFRAALAR